MALDLRASHLHPVNQRVLFPEGWVKWNAAAAPLNCAFKQSFPYAKLRNNLVPLFMAWHSFLSKKTWYIDGISLLRCPRPAAVKQLGNASSFCLCSLCHCPWDSTQKQTRSWNIVIYTVLTGSISSTLPSRNSLSKGRWIGEGIWSRANNVIGTDKFLLLLREGFERQGVSFLRGLVLQPNPYGFCWHKSMSSCCSVYSVGSWMFRWVLFCHLSGF